MLTKKRGYRPVRNPIRWCLGPRVPPDRPRRVHLVHPRARKAPPHPKRRTDRDRSGAHPGPQHQIDRARLRVRRVEVDDEEAQKVERSARSNFDGCLLLKQQKTIGSKPWPPLEIGHGEHLPSRWRVCHLEHGDFGLTAGAFVCESEATFLRRERQLAESARNREATAFREFGHHMTQVDQIEPRRCCRCIAMNDGAMAFNRRRRDLQHRSHAIGLEIGIFDLQVYRRIGSLGVEETGRTNRIWILFDRDRARGRDRPASAYLATPDSFPRRLEGSARRNPQTEWTIDFQAKARIDHFEHEYRRRRSPVGILDFDRQYEATDRTGATFEVNDAFLSANPDARGHQSVRIEDPANGTSAPCWHGGGRVGLSEHPRRQDGGQHLQGLGDREDEAASVSAAFAAPDLELEGEIASQLRHTLQSGGAIPVFGDEFGSSPVTTLHPFDAGPSDRPNSVA